jgi:hypothetical protein
VINKNGDKKTFRVGDFAQFVKLRSSRAALGSRNADFIALGAKANALLRPVVTDYEQIFALLARGKTHGVRDRLAKAEEYRAVVLQRTTEISDYLNWFEATQMTSRSSAFDNYLKTAEEISEQDRKQKSAVGRYLDQMERELGTE